MLQLCGEIKIIIANLQSNVRGFLIVSRAAAFKYFVYVIISGSRQQRWSAFRRFVSANVPGWKRCPPHPVRYIGLPMRQRRRQVVSFLVNGACTLCIDVIFSARYEWTPVSTSRGIRPVAEAETDGRAGWPTGRRSRLHCRRCGRPRFAAAERDHNSIFFRCLIICCGQWTGCVHAV